MNAPVLASRWTAARFTVAQIWALVEKGVIPDDSRFELLDGEVVSMSPKGPLHEEVRRVVMRWLKKFPDRYDVLAETSLYLDKKTFLEPDFVAFDRAIAIKDLKPADVLLAIEVAHESWAYDSGKKAERYGSDGVQEYWAIHAQTRMIRVHRRPLPLSSGPSISGPSGWGDVFDVAAGDAIAPLCASDLPLRLSTP